MTASRPAAPFPPLLAGLEVLCAALLPVPWIFQGWSLDVTPAKDAARKNHLARPTNLQPPAEHPGGVIAYEVLRAAAEGEHTTLVDHTAFAAIGAGTACIHRVKALRCGE